jgi:hypothetical protein
VPPALRITPHTHILLARCPAPKPQRRPARLPRRTVFFNCICRCRRMRAQRTPIEATPLSATSAELGSCLGLGLGLGSHFSSHAPSCSPLPPSSRHPPFTQYPFPSRSLVRDGQTSPHMPQLVVPHSTCPSLSPSPPRTQLHNRSCSNIYTHPVGALAAETGEAQLAVDAEAGAVEAELAAAAETGEAELAASETFLGVEKAGTHEPYAPEGSA